jgi:hypothetical protein
MFAPGDLNDRRDRKSVGIIGNVVLRGTGLPRRQFGSINGSFANASHSFSVHKQADRRPLIIHDYLSLLSMPSVRICTTFVEPRISRLCRQSFNNWSVL